MRKRKKGKKIILLVLIITIIGIVWNVKEKKELDIKYNIGEAQNKLYSGEGQIKSKGTDGYYTTFVTEENKKKKYIEYKQGGQASWAQNDYWGGTMEENGCGITAISIIASGYGKDVTPEDLRKKYAPHLDGEKISDVLEKEFGIENSDFYFASSYFRKELILSHLEENKPILICVWDKPGTRWTEKSHYMVLLATDGKDKIYVSNPNGEPNKCPSAWYDTDKILPYIAKILFVEES